MVTVIDPLGTPTPVYNRAGVTIITMSAGTAADPCISEGAPEIPHPTGHTIALVGTDTAHTQQPIVLPSDAEIGDVVEVYHQPAVAGLALFPPVGSSFGPSFPVNNGTGSGMYLDVNNVICRKVDGVTWRLIRGA